MPVPVAELSAVLPAHDEVGNLARTVEELTAVLDGLGLDRFEVIVVDDGSTDGTDRVAAALAAADRRVRVVTHDRNRGYGAAVRSGFQAAELDWVFLTDGDGQFDPGELRAVLPLTDRYEAVIGYRPDRADHAGRRVNAWLWRQAVRAAVGIRFRDVDCAFKLLRRERLVEIGPLTADGAAISTELVAKLERAGVEVHEVPVGHRPRLSGTPSGSDLRVILRAGVELLRLRGTLGRATAGRPSAAPSPVGR